MGFSHEKARIVFDAPPSTVDTVHELLSVFWERLPAVSMTDRFSFETALIELSSNVMKHADDGSGLSCELVIRCTGDTLTAELFDSGRPGNVSLSAPKMPDLASEEGRGLSIIHSLVHSVSYDRASGRNRWHLMRRIGKSVPGGPGHAE
jgi:serine/threonine-protein kinase RsbW